MKTDDLIANLAAEAGKRQSPVRGRLLFGLTVGGLVSLTGFLLAMGVRPDLEDALVTWRFDLKLAILVIALVLAADDCLRHSAPLPAQAISNRHLFVLALIAGGISVDLASTPAEAWPSLAIGQNALVCLTAIPVLAVAPFVSVMQAMRSGAPASPAAAGAAVGRLAAVLAALFYGLHCTDDSPLFVATWYTLAVALMMGTGAIAGRFVLRW
ncbi:MAG: DUF1109 domain-containing protein [Hyphomicrobiaceae bacterium]|nr:DUF1109 domain-containing protein [Hyphomicrobiaceae bacterium]